MDIFGCKCGPAILLLAAPQVREPGRLVENLLQGRDRTHGERQHLQVQLALLEKVSQNDKIKSLTTAESRPASTLAVPLAITSLGLFR